MMNKKNNKIRFDVMLNDKFVCTLNIPTLMADDVVDECRCSKLKQFLASLKNIVLLSETNHTE